MNILFLGSMATVVAFEATGNGVPKFYTSLGLKHLMTGVASTV